MCYFPHGWLYISGSGMTWPYWQGNLDHSWKLWSSRKQCISMDVRVGAWSVKTAKCQHASHILSVLPGHCHHAFAFPCLWNLRLVTPSFYGGGLSHPRDENMGIQFVSAYWRWSPNNVRAHEAICQYEAHQRDEHRWPGFGVIIFERP